MLTLDLAASNSLIPQDAEMHKYEEYKECISIVFQVKLVGDSVPHIDSGVGIWPWRAADSNARIDVGHIIFPMETIWWGAETSAEIYANLTIFAVRRIYRIIPQNLGFTESCRGSSLSYSPSYFSYIFLLLFFFFLFLLSSFSPSFSVILLSPPQCFPHVTIYVH
jgi:hypothetical protein